MEEQKCRVPSLNALSFISFQERYIVSQEDLASVGTHIINSSNSETLSELKKLIEKREEYFSSRDWMEKLLGKVNGDERLEELIRKSKFIPCPGGRFMIANYEGYCIEVVNSRVLVRENSSPDDDWLFVGGPDEYRISRDNGGALLTLEMINYIVFLWRDLIETFPDRINYEGLEVFDSDDEADRWEFLEGLVRPVE